MFRHKAIYFEVELSVSLKITLCTYKNCIKPTPYTLARIMYTIITDKNLKNRIKELHTALHREDTQQH